MHAKSKKQCSYRVYQRFDMKTWRKGQFCFVMTLSPWFHAFLNKGIFDGRLNSLSSPEEALHLVSIKRSAASGDENRLNSNNGYWQPFMNRVVVSRGRMSIGQQKESRPLGWSNSESPRFTDFSSNMRNEYSAHAQNIRSGQRRDSCC